MSYVVIDRWRHGFLTYIGLFLLDYHEEQFSDQIDKPCCIFYICFLISGIKSNIELTLHHIGYLGQNVLETGIKIAVY